MPHKLTPTRVAKAKEYLAVKLEESKHRHTVEVESNDTVHFSLWQKIKKILFH